MIIIASSGNTANSTSCTICLIIIVIDVLFLQFTETLLHIFIKLGKCCLNSIFSICIDILEGGGGEEISGGRGERENRGGEGEGIKIQWLIKYATKYSPKMSKSQNIA